MGFVFGEFFLLHLEDLVLGFGVVAVILFGLDGWAFVGDGLLGVIVVGEYPVDLLRVWGLASA